MNVFFMRVELLAGILEQAGVLQTLIGLQKYHRLQKWLWYGVRCIKLESTARVRFWMDCNCKTI